MHVITHRPELDRELILRYDRPGPRYTSYPTAPHFRDDFGPRQYEEILEASAGAGGPLSLYVHIPFCKKRCFFCGCNVAISGNRQRAVDYLDLLEREMAATASRAGARQRKVTQIHWGGGTPTFLPPEGLTRLASIIRRHFELADDCEIGVEVDPRESTPEHLDALAEAGFNRLSLGVQDLDPKVQEVVNRIQPLEMTASVIEGARRRGMTSINVDLIYGLPLQTPDSFGATVREMIELSPDRFAIFNFAYLPAMIPHQRVIHPDSVPRGADKLDLFERAVDELTDAGYVFIGMDHFARPEDPLTRALDDGTLGRNFQGYTTHADADLIAVGVSAIGSLAGAYVQNDKSIPEYTARLDRDGLATVKGLVLSPEDLLRRDVIMTLMSRFGLDKAEMGERHGVDFDRHFATELAELAPLEDDGLVRLSSAGIEVTPAGRFLVRNVAMIFDQYLRQAEPVAFSRTV